MLLFPNAKINLGLDILRRRPDGYHDISTVMVPVPWQDILEIVPSRSGATSLNVTGRRVDCPPEKNLVMKAYRLLEETYGLPPVEIYLRKIIPDGAGLGGGSADAAFTIRGLNELFTLGMTDAEMASAASRLGADCPFFIYDRPMLCTGTGTTLTPVDLDLSGLTVLIAKPPVGVPTAQAYSRVTPAEPAESVDAIVSDHLEAWAGRLKNDFEPSIFPLHPLIASVKQRISALGAIYASLSGSGSAVYGLFGPGTDADKLSDEARTALAGCDIFVSKL